MSQENEYSTEMMIADILLRLKSLENLLLAKGVFTQEEYFKEMEGVANQISKALLEKAQAEGDLDELIKSINPIKS